MYKHFPVRFHGKRKHFNEGCDEYQAPRWFRRHRKHHHI
jgi:hypothetical protein